MAFLRLALPIVMLAALSSPAFAAFSADPADADPDVTGSVADAPSALMQVEIGAGSSGEIAIEKEELAPPATTPEDLKAPRQSDAQ